MEMEKNFSSAANGQAQEIEILVKRVEHLEKRPKSIPPKPRKALPWPRAALHMTYVVMVGLILIALLLIVASALN